MIDPHVFPLSGVRLDFIEEPRMVLREQFRFPRTKRRRIRKKWRKRDENYRTVPDPEIRLIDNAAFGIDFTVFPGNERRPAPGSRGYTVVGHPVTIAKLKRALSNA